LIAKDHTHLFNTKHQRFRVKGVAQDGKNEACQDFVFVEDDELGDFLEFNQFSLIV
jgi:hypothetical protein